MANTLHWFRRDLRLDDNPALAIAISETSSQNDKLLCVYCHDEILETKLSFGPPRVGRFRKKFLRESLDCLASQLKSMGSELLEVYGNSATSIFDCAVGFKATVITFQKEVAPEEINAEIDLHKRAHAAGIQLKSCDSGSLTASVWGPFCAGTLPLLFTEYRKKVEASNCFPQPLSIPEWLPAPPPELSLLKQIAQSNASKKRNVSSSAIILDQDLSAYQGGVVGGERFGNAHLKDYFSKSNAVLNYVNTRNDFEGPESSTRFSFWLANGSLSARRCLSELKKFELDFGSNKSTYWIFFELLWRDFFRAVSLKYGCLFYMECGIQQKPPIRSLNVTDEKRRFQKWCSGTTGEALVDACMNELNSTGCLSNRGRQIVASYLINDLKVRWTWGACYFESLLIDYDPSSNWGNWSYLAGGGNDARSQRVFNLTKQAETYDADEGYRGRWKKKNLA